MFHTKATKMLGIEHPILCGGMMWVSEATLVASVSEAGGLGILASNMFPDRKSLQREIQKIKSLTKKPFGVNINLFPALRPPNNQELIEVCIEARPLAGSRARRRSTVLCAEIARRAYNDV